MKVYEIEYYAYLPKIFFSAGSGSAFFPQPDQDPDPWKQTSDPHPWTFVLYFGY